MLHFHPLRRASLCLFGALIFLSGCATTAQTETSGELAVQTGSSVAAQAENAAPGYLIGPYDKLEVFVWRADDLSTKVTVRPDGRISTPLVADMVAAGKTPSQLSTDLEAALSQYVKDPEVTVIVDDFQSTFSQQIRVIGEAQTPQAIPYQTGMTVLDVMLSVGGLTEYAAGNRARLIRGEGADKVTYRVRLHDLLRRGDVTANAPVQPGDVILIPESLF